MLSFIAECGWPAWVVFLVSILALALAAVTFGLAFARFRAAVLVGIASVVFSLLPPAVGIGGTLLGRSLAESAVTAVEDPHDRRAILAAGYAEAAQCTSIGLGCGALPFLASAVGLVLALARRRRPEQAPG